MLAGYANGHHAWNRLELLAGRRVCKSVSQFLRFSLVTKLMHIPGASGELCTAPRFPEFKYNGNNVKRINDA